MKSKKKADLQVHSQNLKNAMIDLQVVTDSKERKNKKKQ